MLRIVAEDVSTDEVVLHLEGQVVGPWVAELERVCDSVLARGGDLELDLSAVSFLSREALDLLSRLGRRARLSNCSRFVAEQLKAAGAAAALRESQEDRR